MTGRVIIVTGASAGLGYEVARYLCEGGNDVILACRSEEKTNRAIEKIKRTNPNALATFMNLDLAAEESIRKFVDDFHQTEKKLHVLVNNAGVALNPKDNKRQLTKENFEIHMGTNHLGHFLLTNLLVDDLKKTAAEEDGDARVVTVTSSTHDPETLKRRNNLQPFELDNIFLFKEGTYNGLQAYKNSKAANLMFNYELARQLDGTNISSLCVCPGYVPSTELMRNASGAQKFLQRYIVHGMLRFTKMTRTVAQGAQAICTAATEEKWKGKAGLYLKDGAETKSSEESLNEENQKKLWELSSGYVGLEGFERIEVTPPPPEEEKKEEKKEEKEEAAAEDGEAKPAADGEEEKEGEKKEGEEKEGDEKAAEKEDDVKKEEEKKEEKTDEIKEEKKEEESKPVEEEKKEEKAE